MEPPVKPWSAVTFENIESTYIFPFIEGKFNHGALIRTLRSDCRWIFRTAVWVVTSNVLAAVSKEISQRLASVEAERNGLLDVVFKDEMLREGV
jgi:hypothetical protein